MEASEILKKLESTSQDQTKSQNLEVKNNAITLIRTSSDLETLLLNLLTTVVKPLFAKQHHPNLTATGRRKLVPDAPFPSRLANPIDWEDEEKIWKNGWTFDLLQFILSQYRSISPLAREKSTFEAQFHLLIPPILNQIDDSDIKSRKCGCELLRLLCEEATRCGSDILKRTGLSDVFSDALTPNFLSLPTLTPEDESLILLSVLYPAFRALVTARFPSLEEINRPHGDKSTETHSLSTKPNKTPRLSSPGIKSSHSIQLDTTQSSSPEAKGRAKEKASRQAMLDLILRNGVLASYAHASDYVRITTFLLHEAALVISMMGIYSAKYLQTFLPLLRKILCDPFATACVPLLVSTLECMEAVICVCWPRIQEKWWGECLRAVVGCWMLINEEEEGERQSQQKMRGKDKDVAEVKGKLQEMVALLRAVVGDDFKSAEKRITDEDELLETLFSK